jgi:hypothetical protein
VQRHFFSDSADYLRGVGDYSDKTPDPQVPFARDLSTPDTVRWTRQILFLKDKRAAGPNYFIFRDSYRNRDQVRQAFQPDNRPDAVRLDSLPYKLPQTWWYQRTLGTRDQVAASDNGFEYASPWGPKMDVCQNNLVISEISVN